MYKLLFSAVFAINLLVGAAFAAKPLPQIEKAVLLTENNHVLLRGPVTDDSVGVVIEKLSAIISKRNNLNYKIYLVLDTPGGSVDAGFRLYEFLHTYSNIDTLTIGSYSMGAVLVEMLPGERLITETGTIMFHRMSVAYGHQMPIHQIDSRTQFFLSQEHMVTRKISARTGIALPELQKMIDSDLYMGSEEALEKNFVDKVVSVRCSKQLLQEKITEFIPGGGFLPDATVERSACPLSP